jgi:tritrans,polycis-undecaprenyl-diphosphate synthase [geranylgeranyl-diphosphate specific]
VAEERGWVPDAITDAFSLAAERTLLRRVQEHEVPNHIAIIMDGNRRFAREVGMSPVEGHEAGRDTLEDVVDWCLDIDVEVLTVYAFSTENFTRKPGEVQALMDLFEENFYDMAEDERVHEHGIRVRAIGRTRDLPEDVREAIDYAEAKTEDYDNYHYNIAIAYGGRQEIVSAIRSIAEDVEAGELEPGEITEKHVDRNLYTAPHPDPDLILRTSGEERISNFLLWQLAYSELYFADVNWPDLRKVDFLRAIRDYQRRQRRFGE